jgi:hypothetical protein
VDRVNVAAQILLVVLGAIGFYEARTFSAVEKFLSKLGLLKRFIFRSRTVTTIQDKTTGECQTTAATATGLIAITPLPRPPGTAAGVNERGHEMVVVEEYSEDLSPTFYLTVAGSTIVLLVVIGRPITFWLALPFVEVARSVTVWSTATWTWYLLLVPVLSLAHLILGLLAFVITYTFCLSSLLKSALLASSYVAKRLTPTGFKLVLFVFFVVASVITLVFSS